MCDSMLTVKDGPGFYRGQLFLRGPHLACMASETLKICNNSKLSLNCSSSLINIDRFSGPSILFSTNYYI